MKNTTLNINNLSILDAKLTTVSTEIKSLNETRKTIIKDILNTVLNGIRELNSLNEYSTYSKKAKTEIISIKLDKNIENSLTRKIVKSVVIYLNSKSSLDLNSVSVSKFNTMMQLINKGLHTKVKSNLELEAILKEHNKIKLLEKVSKLRNKA